MRQEDHTEFHSRSLSDLDLDCPSTSPDDLNTYTLLASLDVSTSFYDNRINVIGESLYIVMALLYMDRLFNLW